MERIWSDERRAHFRYLLEKKKKTLLEIEKDMEERAFEDLTINKTGELSEARLHPADLGSDSFDQEIGIRLAEHELEEIQEIEHAIDKLNHEKYGVCEDCEVDIEEKRLDVVPETRYCSDCEVDLEQKRKARRHPHEESVKRNVFVD